MKEELLKLFSQYQISAELVDLTVYGLDASQITGEAILVVWPKNCEELCQVVKIAKEQRISITPRGAGTGLVGGAVPQQNLVLSLEKMNRILEINPDLKYAVVQAGVVLDQLNEALKETGLYFPVIPGSHAACTLGGMAAANAAGLRAVKYGKTNDWILSVKIINGAAELLELTGSEINQAVGWEGTSGIIAELKLKLAPVLKNTYLGFEKVGSLEELIKRASELKKQPMVVALEFLSPDAAQEANLEAAFYILIEFEGFKTISNETRRVWLARETIAPQLVSRGLSAIGDPRLDLNQSAKLLEWFLENKIPVFGHLGFGIFHPHFRPNDTAKIAQMYQLVQELAGEVTGEHGIGLMKKNFLPAPKINQFKELKKKFDPEYLLNPGKLYDQFR